LDSISLSHEDNTWEFRSDRGGKYSIKENYLYLCHRNSPSSISSLSWVTCRVVEDVWKSWVPSKVVVFWWQLLLGRLPTRVNLANRSVTYWGPSLLSLWYFGPFQATLYIIFSLLTHFERKNISLSFGDKLQYKPFRPEILYLFTLLGVR
jgi:hypothetical protein